MMTFGTTGNDTHTLTVQIVGGESS
jgi:hypothetical protein